MAQLNGLPVFYIKINEDLTHKTGIDFISLVDCPAIESNWVAMANDKRPLKFSLDQDKQLLCGPILIPGLPIYRNDNGVEYYVVFTEEEIEKLVRKFQASQKTINLNYQHQKDSQLTNAVIQEIWLTGKSDKSKDYGFDLPVKSAFVCAYIGDKKFWDEEVKTGKVLGFSIEGFLDMEMKKMKSHKFTEAKVANDNSIYIDGEIAVGSMVYYNTPQTVLINGQKSEIKNLVWESNITLADGTVLVIAQGKIIEIPNKTNMAKLKLAEAKTSDGKYLKTPADAFAEGVDLMIVAEDRTETPAPIGEYVLESGETITVTVAGKVDKIAEVELNEEEQAIIQEAMKAVIKPMQDKIAELETKLANIPGAASATASTDPPSGSVTKPTKLSTIQTCKSKLQILRKKDAEVKTK